MSLPIQDDTRRLMEQFHATMSASPGEIFTVEYFRKQSGVRSAKACAVLKHLVANKRSRIERVRQGSYRYIPREGDRVHSQPQPPDANRGSLYEAIGRLANGQTILRSESGSLHLVTL